MKKCIIILCHILVLSIIIYGFFNIHGKYLGEVQGTVTRQLKTIDEGQYSYQIYRYYFKYINTEGILCNSEKIFGPRNEFGGYYIRSTHKNNINWYETRLKEGKVYDPHTLSTVGLLFFIFSIIFITFNIIKFLISCVNCSPYECDRCPFKYTCVNSSCYDIKAYWEPFKTFFGYEKINNSSNNY